MGSALSNPAGGASAAGCNGNAALCGRSYSNVTFVGSHNSAFVGILPSQNQLTSVTDQLNLGVRYLQSQTHNENGVIQMCHTSCDLLNQGTFEEYLTPIKTWLDGNPNEVVTLLVTNGDGIAVAEYGNTFEKVGLEQYAYTPPGQLALSAWPTLQTLISSGKRLVVFMDYHADTNSVPYILDEFSYYWETPFGVTDKNFPTCAIDRPAGASADGRMYIVNHFLDIALPFGITIPDMGSAPTTNSVNSITAQTNLCYGQYQRTPNVVLLDYVSLGEAMDAQKRLNNL